MVGSLSSFYFCLSFYFYSSVLYGLLASKQAMELEHNIQRRNRDGFEVTSTTDAFACRHIRTKIEMKFFFREKINTMKL